ncbi:endonuclease YncB(thermonuclease family) [Aquamicrobium lusatiense]|uniref:Endonuclease YncB(Thermonuclease family) n=1 Tax=Aquamicrobium lusatiense TaxID=89772 RepID=A0A7W9S3I4_9HYPH|nr:thermonuclease family protein [Aquamicrobium lusatiense]MBB6013134.1 endonuclease YncB(thermonuclease family) [Aquamicrobium lusatiense]
MLDYGLTILLFGILAFMASRLDQANTRTEQGAARIVDGDSIELDGLRVRLRGIDAPEYKQMCKRGGHDYACGRQSREALLRMTDRRTVACTGWRNDQYGRLLGDCSADGVDLNREMVAQGWAVAYGDFEREEAKARSAKLGLWAGEFEKPRQWRDRQGGRVEPAHDSLAAVGDWLREIFRFW